MKIQKTSVISSLASLLLISAYSNIQSYAQGCVSVHAKSPDTDKRVIELQSYGSENCPVYGLYVQLERNGNIQIVSSPSGWTYGEQENAMSWITDIEPVHSEGKIFGIKLQAQQPYTLHWIALDQLWSPIAEGTFVV